MVLVMAASRESGVRMQPRRKPCGGKWEMRKPRRGERGATTQTPEGRLNRISGTTGINTIVPTVRSRPTYEPNRDATGPGNPTNSPVTPPDNDPYSFLLNQRRATP